MAHTPIPIGKYGPKIDPRGAIGISRDLCTCGRREHLFDILDCQYTDRGWWELVVRHFNGAPHPNIGVTAVYLVEEDRP